MQPWLQGLLLSFVALTFFGAAVMKLLSANVHYHRQMAAKSAQENEMYGKATQKDSIWAFSCIYLSVFFFVVAFFRICHIDTLRQHLFGRELSDNSEDSQEHTSERSSVGHLSDEEDNL